MPVPSFPSRSRAADAPSFGVEVGRVFSREQVASESRGPSEHGPWKKTIPSCTEILGNRKTPADLEPGVTAGLVSKRRFLFEPAGGFFPQRRRAFSQTCRRYQRVVGSEHRGAQPRGGVGSVSLVLSCQFQPLPSTAPCTCPRRSVRHTLNGHQRLFRLIIAPDWLSLADSLGCRSESSVPYRSAGRAGHRLEG